MTGRDLRRLYRRARVHVRRTMGVRSSVRSLADDIIDGAVAAARTGADGVRTLPRWLEVEVATDEMAATGATATDIALEVNQVARDACVEQRDLRLDSEIRLLVRLGPGDQVGARVVATSWQDPTEGDLDGRTVRFDAPHLDLHCHLVVSERSPVVLVRGDDLGIDAVAGSADGFLFAVELQGRGDPPLLRALTPVTDRDGREVRSAALTAEELQLRVGYFDVSVVQL